MSETLDRPTELVSKDECWLPRSPKSPGFARRLLVDLLARVEGGERFTNAGLIVITELTANAVRHGCPRGRMLWVHANVDADRLWIEVHDASSARPVVRLVEASDESGRGLLLVESLAQEWGCRARTPGLGKVVWAVVAPAGGDS